MERKEKLLLTGLIQGDAGTVSECIAFLSVARYVDELGFKFEQSVINGLRVKLTQFLADGGSETHSKPHLSKRSEELVVYLANFAGVKICWEEHPDYFNSCDPALSMDESHVVL